MSGGYVQLVVDGLLDQVGLSNSDPDRAALAVQLSDQLERKIGNAAVAMLDAQGKQAYVALLDERGEEGPSQEELMSFFRSHVPDFDAQVTVAIQEFVDVFNKSMRKGR